MYFHVPLYRLYSCLNIMRKIYLLCILMSIANLIFARRVDPTHVSEIASEILYMKTGVTNYRVSSIDLIKRNIYLIHLAPEGWMLMSSDDSFEPLLAYSLNGKLNKNSLLPDNMEFYVGLYNMRIGKISEKSLNPLVEWNKMYYKSVIRSRSIGTKIEPIINVNWNQPEPFNAKCPALGSSKALVGCVAVAMGQALSVTKHPARPVGNFTTTSPMATIKSFNYDNEEPYNWDNISDESKDNYAEVSRLLYHLGVSVEMQYGLDASGTYTYLVENALKTHFAYNNVKYYWRDEYEGNWEQLIINELGAGRPVVYNGVDTKNNAGHCFNLDGYDGTGMFHVNWGWGGYGNSYFNLNALRDKFMGMDYSDQQGAVIGIAAPSDRPLNINVTQLSAPSGQRPGVFVGKISVETSAVGHTYSYSIRGKYKSDGVYETVPFKIVGDEIYTSQSLSYTAGSYDVEIVVTDEDINASISQGFNIKITGNLPAIKSIEEATSLEYDNLTKTLRLSSLQGIEYIIKSENGVIIKDGSFENQPLEINTQEYPYGKYIINLKDDYEEKELSIILSE